MWKCTLTQICLICLSASLISLLFNVCLLWGNRVILLQCQMWHIHSYPSPLPGEQAPVLGNTISRQNSRTEISYGLKVPGIPWKSSVTQKKMMILLSFTTGSHSWLVNLKTIGFVCTGWIIFSSHFSLQLWFKANSAGLLRVANIWSLSMKASIISPTPHFWYSIIPCTYLHVPYEWAPAFIKVLLQTEIAIILTFCVRKKSLNGTFNFPLSKRTD